MDKGPKCYWIGEALPQRVEVLERVGELFKVKIVSRNNRNGNTLLVSEEQLLESVWTASKKQPDGTYRKQWTGSGKAFLEFL